MHASREEREPPRRKPTRPVVRPAASEPTGPPESSRPVPRPASAGTLAACLTLLAAVAPACTYTPPPNLAAENDRLRASLADAERRNEELRVSVTEMEKRLQSVRGVSDAQMANLILPEKIVIDPLSGPDDFDGQPGNDGIAVYLKPVDRDGDTLKVAGDVRIELYDLANPEGGKLLGTCEFTAEQARGMWYGKLLTYHYTLKCPWQTPPQHEEVTIRVVFTEALTQRVLTAQSVCRVPR